MCCLDEPHIGRFDKKIQVLLVHTLDMKVFSRRVSLPDSVFFVVRINGSK